MKKLLLVLAVLLVAISVYWFMLRKKESGPKPPHQVAMTLKKHSELFNKSIDTLMSSYLALKNAFVESDTAAAKLHTAAFIAELDRIPIDELKKDTASIFETVQSSISDVRANAASLLQQTSIDEMRKDFSMVTEMLYPTFFSAINYEGPKLFLENCPMAFGDDAPANWLSNSPEIVNPYLGKNHPKYKATMLHCGEVKDSVVAK
jgi:hypothetical protein